MIIKPYGTEKRFLEIKENNQNPLLHYAENVFIFNNLLIIPDRLGELSKYYEYWFQVLFNTPKNIMSFNNLLANPDFNLRGTYIFASHPYHENYSHYNFHCLGSMLTFRKSGIINSGFNIIFDCDKTQFQRELSAIHKIEGSFFSLRKHALYKVEKCFYSDSFFKTFNSSDFVQMFEDAAASIECEEYPALYITRKNALKRKTLNEEEVTRYFREKGFKIADFDNLPVLEQIRLMRGAGEICAAHGASGANLLYTSKKRFKFIEMFSNRLVNIHANILYTKNCIYSATYNPPIEKNNKDSNFNVDMNLLNHARYEPSYIFKFTSSKNLPTERRISWQLYPSVKPFCTLSIRLVYAAKILFDKGKFGKALKIWEKIYETNNNYGVIIKLFELSFICGKTEKFKHYEKLLHDIFDLNIYVPWALINIYTKLKDLTRAYKTLEGWCKLESHFKQKELAENLDNLSSLPGGYFLDWQNRPISITYDKKHLKAQYSKGSAVCLYLEKNAARLHATAQCKYIYIKSDSSIAFSENQIPLKPVHISKNCFHILSSSRFLSADANGAIFLSDNPDIFTVFFGGMNPQEAGMRLP